MWCFDQWRRLLGQAFGQAVRCGVIVMCLHVCFCCRLTLHVQSRRFQAGALLCRGTLCRMPYSKGETPDSGEWPNWKIAFTYGCTHHAHASFADQSLLIASWHALPCPVHTAHN